jgi:hypothetical protein
MLWTHRSKGQRRVWLLATRRNAPCSYVCDRRVCLPRDLAPGAGAQWGNLGIAHVGARADRGDAGRRG